MRADAECVRSDPRIVLSFRKPIRIYKVMRILGKNKTLETRDTGAINMATNAIGVLSNDHKIRIVRTDLLVDDRCRAPRADSVGMTIVGVGRGVLVRSAAAKGRHRSSVFMCALIAGRYMRVVNASWKTFTT